MAIIVILLDLLLIQFMVMIAVLLDLLLLQLIAIIAILLDCIVVAIYGFNCHITGLISDAI